MVGSAAVVFGVALVYVPAAFVLVGLGLAALGLFVVDVGDDG
jgi:hypothetical protein